MSDDMSDQVLHCNRWHSWDTGNTTVHRAAGVPYPSWHVPTHSVKHLHTCMYGQLP